MRRQELYLITLKYGKKLKIFAQNKDKQNYMRNIGNQIGISLLKKHMEDSIEPNYRSITTASQNQTPVA